MAATLRETDALLRPVPSPTTSVKTQRGQELHLRAKGKIAAGCPLNVW